MMGCVKSAEPQLEKERREENANRQRVSSHAILTARNTTHLPSPSALQLDYYRRDSLELHFPSRGNLSPLVRLDLEPLL